jgi:hypothetical protein
VHGDGLCVWLNDLTVFAETINPRFDVTSYITPQLKYHSDSTAGTVPISGALVSPGASQPPIRS